MSGSQYFQSSIRDKRLGNRLDLIVNDAVVVEIKSVERFDPIFEAQVLTYLRVWEKGWVVDELQFTVTS